MQIPTSSISRRTFLKGAAAAVPLIALPHWVRANPGGPSSPNNRINIAVIGAGSRGSEAVRQVARAENLVAMCDVDDNRARWSFENFPGVPRFKDYRVLFDQMGDEIDAVTISTPDHMHFPIAMWAIAHGKHVYVEKPLVRTVSEARLLKAAAARAGVITQMGNQGHAGDGIRKIREWIDAGLLGDVRESFHWSDRPVWAQGEIAYLPPEPVPDGLDYDLWLGVAPALPYTPKVIPFGWRGYRSYGCGAIGDMGVHTMDAAYTGLGLGKPRRVEVDATPFSEISFPQASTISYLFDRPGHGDFRLHWMDGGRRPDEVPHVERSFLHGDPGNPESRGTGAGSLIVGTKGTLYAGSHCGGPRIFPRDYWIELNEGGAIPEPTIPRVESVWQEWFDAIRSGTQPGGSFDYAADFTESVLLGHVGIVAGVPIEYDAEAMRITNAPEANQLLHGEYDYRPGFLPG